MKMYLILTLVVYLVLIFFPFISLTDKNNKTDEMTTAINTEAYSQIDVLRVSSGKVESIDTVEYIIGAVASEMPATYHEEALKAQAVACYTYAKRLISGGSNVQYNADITDDSSIHQGYLSEEELKEKWGDKYDTYYLKLQKIAESVQGEYICFNSEPILAAYHAISAGVTNSAETAWGDDIEYLQSVSAPGDTLSSVLESSVTFTSDEVIGLVEKNGSELIDVKAEKLFGTISTDKNGYVISLEIGSTKISGEQARDMFSLKSTNFTVEYIEDKYTFKVYGNGHGVGMSQYSADFMARQGSTYKEILAHFYPGTDILNELS